MSQVNIEQDFQIALGHHQSGRLPQAQSLYRQILAQQPKHAGALHYLGVLSHQTGSNDVAVQLIRQSIALRPDYADAHSNFGNVLKASGQLEAAIAAYRQAIALRPDFPEVYFNLGIVLRDTNQLPEAIAAYRQAIVFRPDFFMAYNNLATALQETQQLDESIVACRQAIGIKPDYAEGYLNLGNALFQAHQPEASIAAYRQAIVLKPNYAEAYGNLANALRQQGQLDEAVTAGRAAVALTPRASDAHNILGAALKDKGHLEEAVAAYRQAIALRSDFHEAYTELGDVLRVQGRFDAAVAACQMAISLRPDYFGAYNNLGNALRSKGQFDEAVAAYRRAIALNPKHLESHCNLGVVLMDQGELNEAIATYRRAIALKPAEPRVHSNLLFGFHFDPDCDAQFVFQQHRDWNCRHAEPLKESILPHANDRKADRRLRIGYVSADIRRHSVSYFVENLLAHHDAASVEVFCYGDVVRPDAVTARIRRLPIQWRSIVGHSDAQVAQQVREDRIDILVDLAGHTANNRLLVFARKPAPIQVTYLGYPDTTGLTAMDYRLTDAHADPPGVTDALHSENLVRLPASFLCYCPSDAAPAVGAVPSLASGRITFGSFNALPKINAPLVSMWSRILEAIPDSRLVLKSHGLDCAGTRRRILQYFQASRMDPDRIVLMARTEGEAEHLQLYNTIDIALDTYPYHGTTTSCEAMWMGVPVITLAGQVHVSRVGVSILSNIGLPELIADSPEAYVRVAIELAIDRARLNDLRSTLRQRMRQSPLMDAPRFARNIEAAYRQMWRQWCHAPAVQS